MSTRPDSLRAWGAAGLWAVVVWTLGSDGFSADDTSRILGPLIALLFPDLSENDSATLLWMARKAAHAIEYAVMALLTLRALRLSAPLPGAPSALATLALVGALATADELRQGVSCTRTGAGSDVVLDFCGALLGLAGVRALPKRLRARSFPTSASER